MNHKIFLYVTGLFLLLGIFASLSQTLAQDGVYDSDTSPGSGGTITNETSNTTGVTTAEEAFNPLWLLPLVAIPILLYLLWPRRRDEDAFKTRGNLAGFKGGRAKEDLDEYHKQESSKYKG